MAQKKQSDIINLRPLFKLYLSKWYLFVISVFCCLVLAFLFNRIRMEKFGVRANLLIQQEDQNPLASAAGGLSGLFGASGQVDDEIFVLSSHSLYRDVVRDLGLNRTHFVKEGFLLKSLAYPDYPIDVLPSAGIADTLKVAVIFRVQVAEDGTSKVRIKGPHSYKETYKDIKLPHTFDTPWGEFTVEQTQFFPKGEELTSNILVTGYHAAAEDLAENIFTTIANKRSNVIEMGYDTPNPTMGEMILQDVIDKYNERGIHEKNAQGQKTADFIDERLALLSADLDDAESAYQHYKENQGIVDVYNEVKYQTTKRGEVEQSLIEAETQLEIIRMTRDFISNPANKYEIIPMTLDNEAIQASISGYNSMLIQRHDYLRTVNPDNTALVRLTDRIDATRNSITSSVNHAYTNAQVVVRDLRKQMADADSRLGSAPRQERDVTDLRRQLEVKQQLFVFLRKHQEENAMLLANAVPKGIVVDAPYTLKDPLGISKKVLFLLAFMLGLCLPPIYLWLLKIIRNRVESREEIQQRTSAPILGEMCVDNSGRSLVVGPTDTSSATELFRLMRANLLFVFNDAGDKVVLTTSTNSGEGKTFVSINLAASLALLGKKVLLVGMDIRAPKIGSYLNVHQRKGLTNYLSDQSMTVEEIIEKSPIADLPQMDIVTAGPVPPNPSELLASRRVDELFSQLRTMYDFIVVDSAPVGMVSDTFSLNRISDATIYVTRLNVTSNDDIATLDEIYTDSRLKKLSVVINGVKGKRTYGYGNKAGHTD